MFLFLANWGFYEHFWLRSPVNLKWLCPPCIQPWNDTKYWQKWAPFPWELPSRWVARQPWRQVPGSLDETGFCTAPAHAHSSQLRGFCWDLKAFNTSWSRQAWGPKSPGLWGPVGSWLKSMVSELFSNLNGFVTPGSCFPSSSEQHFHYLTQPLSPLEPLSHLWI